MYEQIPFTAINGTRVCDEVCLSSNLTGAAVEMLSHDLCPASQYNSAATLLLQPVEEVAQALFLRGAPHALPASSLAAAVAFWFVFTALAASLTLPSGLLVPLMVIGGAIGRLYAVLLDLKADPGLYALAGATAFMAGSGQIRLFLTMIMLETTGQLQLGPYLAAAAITGVWVSQLFTRQGLYHALIHAAGLPYLPPQYHPPRKLGRGLGFGLGSGFGSGLGSGLGLPRGGSGDNSGSGGIGASGEGGEGENGLAAAAAAKRQELRTDDAVRTYLLTDDYDEPPARVALQRRCAMLLGRTLTTWRGKLGGACGAGAGGRDAAQPAECIEVSAVMATGQEVAGLLTAHFDEPCGPLRLRLGASAHNAFPVVDAQGRPRGLLLKSELLAGGGEHGDATPAHCMMDTAPCIVHSRWPLARAHRIFATMGLRHMLVVDPESGRLVGMVTRHDLHDLHGRPASPPPPARALILPITQPPPPPPPPPPPSSPCAAPAAPEAGALDAANGLHPNRRSAAPSSLPALEHGAPLTQPLLAD